MTDAPLAHRLRPMTLEAVIGQQHLLSLDTPFRKALDEKRPISVIFWGPPGCGKTTLARLVAQVYERIFLQLSAVNDGLPKLRKCIQKAEQQKDLGAFGALLFVDEIHRWNTAQQDALLPHVESGLICLVGATTENPYRSVNSALRSRCWMLELHPLSTEELITVLYNGTKELGLTIDDEAVLNIAHVSNGDARRALSILERISGIHSDNHIAFKHIEQYLGNPDLLHDPSGTSHYDITSAFIKCMRNSDPDAALYWMARLLVGGEDPMFIARRLVIFASEDIGNADLRALPVALSCMQAIQSIGMPEAELILGQTCAYLWTAPKSNASTIAIRQAMAYARDNGPLNVPPNISNRKVGYKNPHNYPNALITQPLWPPSLTPKEFYKPKPIGDEDIIAKRLEWWKKRR